MSFNMECIVTKDFLISYLNNLNYFKYLCCCTKHGRNKKEYQEYKKLILKNQNFIRLSISKVKKEHYRKLLTMRYIYCFKWSKIIERLFEKETDFEFQKNYKYRDRAFYWHRQAIKALQHTNKEELTATQLLHKIKRLCKAFTGMNKTENEFITEILTLVGN